MVLVASYGMRMVGELRPEKLVVVTALLAGPCALETRRLVAPSA